MKEKNVETGKEGENIASLFLIKKGFSIIGRNFRKPFGEIDIIAEKRGIVHFVEVKSVSYETGKNTVSYETYRPEENVHSRKIKRLMRVIETYIVSYGTDRWVFDVIVVYIDKKVRKARVKWIKDIILGS